MPRLLVVEGPWKGVELDLEPRRYRVGRDPGCDLALPDGALSREHFALEPSGSEWLVRDLGSSNGTEVNGDVIRGARPMARGDRVAAGHSAFVFDDRVVASVVAGDLQATTIVGRVGADRGDLGALYALTTALAGAAAADDFVRALGETLAVRARSEPARVFVRRGGRLLATRDADGLTLPVAALTATSERGEVALVEARDRRWLVAPVGAPAQWVLVLADPRAVADEASLAFFTCACHLAAGLLAKQRHIEVLASRIEARGGEIGDDLVIGRSEAMKPVLDFVDRAAPTDSSVLLLGESGVGKEVIARALHRRSNRADGPFIAVNCAAIPDSLFEAELFGHEAGAFTGATTRRVGLFEAASRGTLLLDEIGELPLPAQAGLLRAVEERTITRVGGTGRIPVDVRIVAATHRDLEARIETGEFRSDLYYRLSVLVTRIPTLRERPDDVEALAHHFLTVFRQRAPRVVTGFSAEAIAALRRYAWPGNARELRNAIDRAVVLGESTQIELADLPAEIAGRSAPPALGNTHQVTLPMPLARLERLAIEAALKASGGNKSQAAIVLGIDRVTIYNKLKSYAKQDADRGSASEPEGV